MRNLVKKIFADDTSASLEALVAILGIMGFYFCFCMFVRFMG